MPVLAWDDRKARAALAKHLLQIRSYSIRSLPSRKMAALVVFALED